MRHVKKGAILVACIWVSLSAPVAHAATTIAEYDIPTADSQPLGIVQGPDGNMWFTEAIGNKIGKITPSGVIGEYDIPTPDAGPASICAGLDGNLWFTEINGNKIGKITTSGVITEYDIPTPAAYPLDIACGGDGNMWFTETFANKIGKITPSGVISEYDVPTPDAFPAMLIWGPGDVIWFTENGTNLIAVITSEGAIYEASLPAESQPLGITVGPNGNVWITENGSDHVTEISMSGLVLSRHLVDDNLGVASKPSTLVLGPDGKLWINLQNFDIIATMSADGVLGGYEVPTYGSGASGITRGPNNTLWFVEQGGNKIGVIRGIVADPTPPSNDSDSPAKSKPLLLAKHTDDVDVFETSEPEQTESSLPEAPVVDKSSGNIKPDTKPVEPSNNFGVVLLYAAAGVTSILAAAVFVGLKVRGTR